MATWETGNSAYSSGVRPAGSIRSAKKDSSSTSVISASHSSSKEVGNTSSDHGDSARRATSPERAEQGATSDLSACQLLSTKPPTLIKNREEVRYNNAARLACCRPRL